MLAEGYEQLRLEAKEGRVAAAEGLTREATAFYDYIMQLAFENAEIAPEPNQALKALVMAVVEVLQNAIDIMDFWKKPNEVKKLRGSIATEVLLTNIPELTEKHERIAIEIVKLAEKRHRELVG